MEHANLHQQQHHQLQDGRFELSGSSSSPSNSSLTTTTPSSYGGGAGSAHAWTQNFTLNTNIFNPNCDEVVLNPRHKNDLLVPPFNSSMIQYLSPHWTTNAGSSTGQFPTHENLLILSHNREELSGTFPKFTNMLSSSPSSIEDSHGRYVKNEQKDLTDLSEKLLLKTISSGFPINGHNFCTAGGIYSSTQNYSDFGSGLAPTRPGSFSQIYPSVNISNLNQPSSSIPAGSFDMNLQAFDLFNSTRLSGSFGEAGEDSLNTFKTCPSFGLDRVQQSSPRSSCSPSKDSTSFNNEITTESKRPNNNSMEPTATTKKSRVESHTSCPPLKVQIQVRKEKLGDRVAALHQLVAPFGKTDTASVLMEAIGYIKFLQGQVETLSVPYMKSCRSRTNIRNMHTAPMAEDGTEKSKGDLRSQGLCLVPLSCMSYVTDDDNGNGCGGIWPPPNYEGGT